MATAKDLGMMTPTGDDYIRDGDNAISTNAEITARLYSELRDGKAVPAGANLDTYRTPGDYHIALGTVWDSLTGRPAVTGQAGWLTVSATPNGLIRQQLATYGAKPAEYSRVTASASSGAFGPWTRTDPAGQVAPYAGAASMTRAGLFTAQRGISYTNGRAAVALRFDHGLVNFRDLILPLLRKYGLPWSLALNSRTWDRAENAGVTPAEVVEWVTKYQGEVWNHGATHTNADTAESLRDEIVTGLAELRTQLPGVSIDGFAVPGVGSPGYGGFNSGASAEAFYGTEAGRLILENHAVTTGSLPGTARRVLNGTVQQGMNHHTMDSQTYAQIKTQIDAAKNEVKGLQLMLHPSLLGTAGYMTADTLDQVLGYIAAEREAGRLVPLSPYALTLADSTPLPRVSQTAGRVVTVWDAVNKRDQLIYGDTGIRQITERIETFTEGTLKIRRTGNTVSVSMTDVRLTNTGTFTLAGLIPAGFRPDMTVNGSATYITLTDTHRMSISPSGNLAFYGYTGSYARFYVTYTTAEPWPTTLPGIPG